MNEIWKTLIYNGETYSDFEVSNMGKLRRVSTNKILKTTLNAGGYFTTYTTLGSREKGKLFKIHRAVACTFLPNPENKPTVNHIDGNKTNNCVENLEWATYGENNKHAFDTGLKSNAKGSKSPFSREVNMYSLDGTYIKTFGSIRDAEEETNISDSSIIRCYQGKHKTAGGFCWEYAN